MFLIHLPKVIGMKPIRRSVVYTTVMCRVVQNKLDTFLKSHILIRGKNIINLFECIYKVWRMW